MGPFGKYLTELLKYDKMLPMNSGVEACETACKIARRYAYRVKGTPDNTANILLPSNTFWGRSITASGGSDDPTRYKHFGPFTPGFEIIPYDDLDVLEQKLKSDPTICAYLVEPIQGEAGCLVPSQGYLKKC